MAQIRFPEKRGAFGLVAVGRELGCDLLAQFVLDRGEIGDAHPVEPLADRPQRRMLDVGGEHAERAEDARHRRNHHARNPELPRQIRRVHAAIAAERHQRQVAGVQSALHRDRADRARHRGIGHGPDAMRRVLHRQGKRISDMDADGLLAQRAIDMQLAARQRGRVDEAQHHIGVRHGRPVIAEAVACRSRHRAGRLRPDDQEAALVDAGDRTAAGADLGDVDRGHLEHVAAGLDEAARCRDAVAKLVFRGHAGAAVLDDDGLGGGAAHVEHDDIAVVARDAEPGRADDAAGRTGGHHQHRLFAGHIRRQHAAVRGHDQDRRRDADGAKSRIRAAADSCAWRQANRRSPPSCWCVHIPSFPAARRRTW